MKDILKIKNVLKREYNTDIDELLSDYVPYASNSLFMEKIRLGEDTSEFYGVDPEYQTIIEKYTIDKAIENIYNKTVYCEECHEEEIFKEELMEIFVEFIKERTFLHLDDKMLLGFVIPALIPLIQKYTYRSNSLGKRIRQIIKEDIFKSKELIELKKRKSYDSELSIYKDIISISSKYVIELQKMYNDRQHMYDEFDI